MATTSGPQPPSYESLTPYYHDSNAFDDSEKQSASVQLSRAIPRDLANSSAPSFWDGRYFIPSITAHKLSFSSVPPPALAHLIPAKEWAAFTTSLSAATALSSGQKAKVIVAGVSVGIFSCWPGVGTCIGRAVWRKEIEKMISMQGENHGYEFDAADKGNVGAVLDRWNHAWGAKGLRVGLLISTAVDANQLMSYKTPVKTILAGNVATRIGASDMEEDTRNTDRGEADVRKFMLLVEKTRDRQDMDPHVISQQDDGAEERMERRFFGLKIGETGDKKF
ncbi:MAG: hypothetical protein Q9212_000815 [Teloschistes hypoglaucus]